MAIIGFIEILDRPSFLIMLHNSVAVKIAVMKTQLSILWKNTGRRILRIIAAQTLQRIKLICALLYFFSRNSFPTRRHARKRRNKKAGNDEVLLK